MAKKLTAYTKTGQEVVVASDRWRWERGDLVVDYEELKDDQGRPRLYATIIDCQGFKVEYDS